MVQDGQDREGTVLLIAHSEDLHDSLERDSPSTRDLELAEMV
jgi:hypothetical protein